MNYNHKAHVVECEAAEILKEIRATLIVNYAFDTGKHPGGVRIHPCNTMAMMIGALELHYQKQEIAEKEVEKLRMTFGHVHQAGQSPRSIDSCQKCGLDIRDEIHHKPYSERS